MNAVCKAASVCIYLLGKTLYKLFQIMQFLLPSETMMEVLEESSLWSPDLNFAVDNGDRREGILM